jgi:prolyl-tRNA editing enzyme YbaK/EbsC (Cys-tRNA(Pro) deacylase)
MGVYMSYINVKNYFEKIGLLDCVKDLGESSATVDLAAAAIGCLPKEIVKSLSLLIDDNPILVVMAGDRKIDNSKYTTKFHKKAKMIPYDLVEPLIGHDVGGVCPFATKDNVKIYLDTSLLENQMLYIGGGNEHCIVELTLDKFKMIMAQYEWVDVCKQI